MSRITTDPLEFSSQDAENLSGALRDYDDDRDPLGTPQDLGEPVVQPPVLRWQVGMKKPPSSLPRTEREQDSLASSEDEESAVPAPAALDDSEGQTQLYQAPTTRSRSRSRSRSPKKASRTRSRSPKKASLSPEKEHNSPSKLQRAHTRHVVEVAVQEEEQQPAALMPEMTLGKPASVLLEQHVQRILQEKPVQPVAVRMIPVQPELSQAYKESENELYRINFEKDKMIHDLDSAVLLEQQSETRINLLRENTARRVKELRDFEGRAVAEQSVYVVPLTAMREQHEIDRQAIIAQHAEHVLAEKSLAMKLLSQQDRDRIEVHSLYEINTADKRRTDFVHMPTMSAPVALPAKNARPARPVSKGNGMVRTQSTIVRNDTYYKLANRIQDVCGLPNFVLPSVPLCKPKVTVGTKRSAGEILAATVVEVAAAEENLRDGAPAQPSEDPDKRIKRLALNEKRRESNAAARAERERLGLPHPKRHKKKQAEEPSVSTEPGV